MHIDPQSPQDKNRAQKVSKIWQNLLPLLRNSTIRANSIDELKTEEKNFILDVGPNLKRKKRSS